jgi:hypothetical protein
LLYVIAAALAEWERQTISRRTKEGLKAAQNAANMRDDIMHFRWNKLSPFGKSWIMTPVPPSPDQFILPMWEYWLKQ